MKPPTPRLRPNPRLHRPDWPEPCWLDWLAQAIGVVCFLVWALATILAIASRMAGT